MTRLHSNLQIGVCIGAGFFGEVFMGKDEVHGDVAVKVLRQRPNEPDLAWHMRKSGLLREGQRLKHANHTNVVQVINVLESPTNDEIHLVMEYCTGGSLQKLFEIGPMRTSDLRKIATGVTLGLQAIHARQMLHRDIKPGNILIDKNGIAKLGDFGLVTDNIILGYGSQAGYSDHLAPEVFAGSGTSIRTDIWALGMTIYRLLHGADWYSRGTVPRDVVGDGGYADTLRWLPHVPQRWRRVIRKMLQDDPHTRYQNANQVISAIAGLPIEPDWHCTVAPLEIRWKREVGERRIFVVWQKLSLRKYTWKAWSEPKGKGNHRSMGDSASPIGQAQSERELRTFFEEHV